MIYTEEAYQCLVQRGFSHRIAKSLVDYTVNTRRKTVRFGYRPVVVFPDRMPKIVEEWEDGWVALGYSPRGQSDIDPISQYEDVIAQDPEKWQKLLDNYPIMIEFLTNNSLEDYDAELKRLGYAGVSPSWKKKGKEALLANLEKNYREKKLAMDRFKMPKMRPKIRDGYLIYQGDVYRKPDSIGRNPTLMDKAILFYIESTLQGPQGPQGPRRPPRRRRRKRRAQDLRAA